MQLHGVSFKLAESLPEIGIGIGFLLRGSNIVVRPVPHVECGVPEGDALLLLEHLRSGTYETRIYLYQGHIVEEYAPEGKPYAPEKATQIMMSDNFSFDYEAGLLTITTDAGSTEVALRCAKGGA